MPRTPDDFSGVSIEEGLLLINDGYGVPGTPGEIRYSGGHFYAKDGYELFDVRTNVNEHVISHLADGTDSFYVISPNAPTSYEDKNDGYEVGWRWIDTTDGYEFVLIDNTVGAAVWANTTGSGGGGGGPPDPHVNTHLGNGSDTFYVISSGTPGSDQDINDGYEIGFRWIRSDGYEYVCLDNTVGKALWKRTTNEPCPGTNSVYFDAYDTVGGTNISSGWTDVPLDGERIKDPAFSHTGSSAEVTINVSGTYLVLGRIGTDISSGTSRSDSEMRMMLDTGSGYVEIPGSRGFMYNRTLNNGGTHASVSMVLSLNVGDKLKIQAHKDSGSSTVVLRANNSGLVIVAPGSGSGINADDHKILRQLIHFIDDGPAEGFASGAYKETTGTVFPTAMIWYTDSGKTEKIVERLVTWSGPKATVDKWKIYDDDGTTVLWTISDAISYSGVFETSRTRTITQGDA